MEIQLGCQTILPQPLSVLPASHFPFFAGGVSEMCTTDHWFYVWFHTIMSPIRSVMLCHHTNLDSFNVSATILMVWEAFLCRHASFVSNATEATWLPCGILRPDSTWL